MADEPVQIVLEAVFDVESDGGLEKGWFLCRFRVFAIAIVQLPGGSTNQPVQAEYDPQLVASSTGSIHHDMRVIVGHSDTHSKSLRIAIKRLLGHKIFLACDAL